MCRLPRIATAYPFALLLTVTACTGPSAIYERSQSHYDFPNSNIRPLGAVTVELSRTSAFFPRITDPDLEEEAILTALADSNGDILIDGLYIWNSTFIPLPFVRIYNTTLRIEGTAAKMELIRQ